MRISDTGRLGRSLHGNRAVWHSCLTPGLVTSVGIFSDSQRGVAWGRGGQDDGTHPRGLVFQPELEMRLEHVTSRLLLTPGWVLEAGSEGQREWH